MMTTTSMSFVTLSEEVNTSHVMGNGSMVGGEIMEEQFWFQSVYLGYLWTALIIGLPGNILIAVVYMTVQQKRTSDWFIFFLSVYDCAVCVFAVPLYLSIETGVWAATGSDLACKIEQFTIFTAQFSSVSILGIIAVDRYLKICLPTKRSLNATQARNIGICTPLIAALVAAPVLVWDGNVEHKFCRLQERYQNTLGVKVHRCSTFGFFVCMFCVVIFCYAHVCVVVRRRIQRHKENVMKRKHLMQIPAFLQAISNVDDPTGHASGRVHRSKRKFSLFSLGSSRRLSAITPWVKARLSLPSESVARNMGLPLDEVELESKESLAESKKKLDQALKLRGQAGVRALNYKEKKELFKEHIEKLKDRKRAEKERNEREEVIEELSGNDDSEKQIKDDMRTLDKIFSTSEFTLANCTAHSSVIDNWRKIYSSPGQRKTTHSTQHAAETSERSVESKLSEITRDVCDTESHVNVDNGFDRGNTCVVSVHREDSGVLGCSSGAGEVKDPKDVFEYDFDEVNISSTSNKCNGIHINKDVHQSNCENSVDVCNKENRFIPEIPDHQHRLIPSVLVMEHQCKRHSIPVHAQQTRFTQQLTSSDVCDQQIFHLSLNENKQTAETADLAQSLLINKSDSFHLTRSCASVSCNSRGHERDHGTGFTRVRPSHSLSHLPHSNSSVASICQLQHANVPRARGDKKTGKSDSGSKHFCNKVSSDPDIGAMRSREKMKFEYTFLNGREIDSTCRHSAKSQSGMKARHITDGLALARERNPVDLVSSQGKSTSKSSTSWTRHSMSDLDADKPFIKNLDQICKCDGSMWSRQNLGQEHDEIDNEDCTQALLGKGVDSGNFVKFFKISKSKAIRQRSCPCRESSISSCNGSDSADITQALLCEEGGSADTTLFCGQGRGGSCEYLKENYPSVIDASTRDNVTTNCAECGITDCIQNPRTGSNLRRLKHQVAVEEYGEEDHRDANDIQIKVKTVTEEHQQDTGKGFVYVHSKSCNSSRQRDSLDTEHRVQFRNDNTANGISTPDLGPRSFESGQQSESTAVNIYSQQQKSIGNRPNDVSSTDQRPTINYSTQLLTRPGVIDPTHDGSDVTSGRRVCLPVKPCDTELRPSGSDIDDAIQHSTQPPSMAPRGAVPQSHQTGAEVDATRSNTDGAMWVSGSLSYKGGKSKDCDFVCNLINSSNHKLRPHQNTEKVPHVTESLEGNNGSGSFRRTSLFNSAASVQEYLNYRTLSDPGVKGHPPDTCAVVTENNKTTGPLHPALGLEQTSPARDETKRELAKQRDFVMKPRENAFNPFTDVTPFQMMNTQRPRRHSKTNAVTDQIKGGVNMGSATTDPSCCDIPQQNSALNDVGGPEKHDKNTTSNTCHKQKQNCFHLPHGAENDHDATAKHKSFEADTSVYSIVGCRHDTRFSTFKYQPDSVQRHVTQGERGSTNESPVYVGAQGTDSEVFAVSELCENTGSMTPESFIAEIRCAQYMTRKGDVPSGIPLLTQTRDFIDWPICLYNEQSGHSFAQHNELNRQPLCPFRCDCMPEDEIHQHFDSRGLVSCFRETSFSGYLQILAEYSDITRDACRVPIEVDKRYTNRNESSSCHAECVYHATCDGKERAYETFCFCGSSEFKGQQSVPFLTFVPMKGCPLPTQCDLCLVQNLSTQLYGLASHDGAHDDEIENQNLNIQIINNFCYISPSCDLIGITSKKLYGILGHLSTRGQAKSDAMSPTERRHSFTAEHLDRPVLIYDVINNWLTFTPCHLHDTFIIFKLMGKVSYLGQGLNGLRSPESLSEPSSQNIVRFLNLFIQRHQINHTNPLCKKQLPKIVLKSAQSHFMGIQNNFIFSFAHLHYAMSESHDCKVDLLKTTCLNVLCLQCFHISTSVYFQHTHNSHQDWVCENKMAQSDNKVFDELFPFANIKSSKQCDVMETSLRDDCGACADLSCQRASLTTSVDLGNWKSAYAEDATRAQHRKSDLHSNGTQDKSRRVVPHVINATSHEIRCLQGRQRKNLKKVKSLGDMRLFTNRVDDHSPQRKLCSFHKKFPSVNSISHLCTSSSNVAKQRLKNKVTEKMKEDFKCVLRKKLSQNVCLEDYYSVAGTDNSCVPLLVDLHQINNEIDANHEIKIFCTPEKFCFKNGISRKHSKCLDEAPECLGQGLECLDAKIISVSSENKPSQSSREIENWGTGEDGAFSGQSSSSALLSRGNLPGQRSHASLAEGSTRKSSPDIESNPSCGSEIPLINVDSCEPACLLGGALAPLASHFNKLTKVINENPSPPFSLTIQNKKCNSDNDLSAAVVPPPSRPRVLGGPLCDLTSQINTTNVIHSTLLKCLPTYSVTAAVKAKDASKPNNETCAYFVKSVFDAFFTTPGMSSSSEPCLNTVRENEEVYEFPLFPLSSGNLDTPDFARRKGDVYNLPGPSRLSSGNRSPWKNSSRSSGISHSWYSLNDLDPTNKPTLLRNSRFMYLTAIRRQLNNVFSPKSIRQFFGISDSPTLKKSGNKTIPRDRLSTNHINVIITRCESLVMDKSEDELPPMRSRAVTLDPTCMDKGTRSSNDSVYYFNNGAGARCESVTTPKPRASSLDTTHSSVSRSDDQSLHSRSQDTSFDRSRGCSLDLLSPASASLRTGSMCSGISSMSRLTECSAYTEHSRSDCEKITRRTAEREHNITRLLGVITMIFVISWSVSWGVILYNTLSLVPVPDSSHVVLSLPRDLFLINHFCNIIVYTVLSRSFRDKLSQCYSSVKVCL